VERTAPLGHHPGTPATELRLRTYVLPHGAKDDRRIPAIPFAVLAYAGTSVDRRTGRGRLLQLEIADRLSLSLSSVEHAFTLLRRLGWIRTSKRRRNACAEYQLWLPSLTCQDPHLDAGPDPHRDAGLRARLNNSTNDLDPRQVQTTLSGGDAPTSIDDGLAERVFVACGGDREFAQLLVNEHGADRVATWCDALDFVRSPIESRAAFLVDALRKHYPLPPAYKAALNVRSAPATAPAQPDAPTWREPPPEQRAANIAAARAVLPAAFHARSGP
jgi:hypothetical protein